VHASCACIRVNLCEMSAQESERCSNVSALNMAGSECRQSLLLVIVCVCVCVCMCLCVYEKE
jgi:hypothetical protein